jgi:hypothetical protein
LAVVVDTETTLGEQKAAAMVVMVLALMALFIQVERAQLVLAVLRLAAAVLE